jgi:hypothetical protein
MKNHINFLILLIVLAACQTKNAKVEIIDSTKTVIDTLAVDTPKTNVMYLEDVLQCVDLQGLEKNTEHQTLKKMEQSKQEKEVLRQLYYSQEQKKR